MIVDLVIESEKKLNSIANIDLLTDLYSRRYMINYLEEYDADDEGWLAMADVDDFKKINHISSAVKVCQKINVGN